MAPAHVRIIIPTHDRRTLLPRAIASVTRQDFPNWELVIVDDGSSDGTSEYLQDLQHTWSLTQNFKILKTRNSGVSAARNRGTQGFQGSWLAFLDSDDEWLPHKLSAQLKIAEDSKLPFIHGEEIWIRNGRRVNPKPKYKKSGGWIFERCVDHCCISASTSLISRDFFNDLQGFREDFRVCEDYELWLRIAARTEVAFVSAPVTVKYGGHADQLSTRFHSMDDERVRALIPFLKSPLISEEQRSYVAENIYQRVEILINGLRKRLTPNTNADEEARLRQLLLLQAQVQKPSSL